MSNKETARLVLTPGLEQMLDDYMVVGDKDIALSLVQGDIRSKNEKVETLNKQIAELELIEQYLTTGGSKQ